MWIKAPKTSDPLMQQRVIDDVNSALAAKGLQLVTSDADLCIAAHAATKQERTLNTFYNGFGGGWRWGGRFGDATTTVDTYEVGTLVVDIFDARTKEAIWRGTSSKTLSGNPQKNAGTRVRANKLQADAALEQRRAELAGLDGRIDEQIRTAFLNLTSSSNLVAVTESNIALANQTLTQARDRFSAGVADNLEVVQAQELVAAANQSYIASLYAYNAAKVSLAQAIGIAEQSALTYLGVK